MGASKSFQVYTYDLQPVYQKPDIVYISLCNKKRNEYSSRTTDIYYGFVL